MRASAWSAALPTCGRAGHLGIPKGSAILYVERQTFGYRKSRPMEPFPVEFVKMSYNAEKYTFHQIIRKE